MPSLFPGMSPYLENPELWVLVDMQSLLGKVYEQAGFDLAIDYSLEPISPLKQEDRVWADALLREKGLR